MTAAQRRFGLLAVATIAGTVAACTAVLDLREYDDVAPADAASDDATMTTQPGDDASTAPSFDAGDGDAGTDDARPADAEPDGDAGLLDAADGGCAADSYCALILSDQPRAYFRFDELVPNQAAPVAPIDSTGHGFTMTTNGASVGSPAPIGGAGRGLLLYTPSATDGGMATRGSFTIVDDVGNPYGVFLGSTPFTFELWVRIEPTLRGTERIFGNADPPHGGWRLFQMSASDGGATSVGFEIFAATHTDAYAAVSSASYHYVATVYDGIASHLFIDGQELVHEAAPDGGLLPSSIAPGGGAVSATLDELAVYERALDGIVIRRHAQFTPP